jgi:hypothetical protein
MGGLARRILPIATCEEDTAVEALWSEPQASARAALS